MSVSTRKRQKKNRKGSIISDGIPARIPMTISLKPPRYFARKRYFDRLLAALLIVPGAIVVVFFAILVRLTSRGWPMFWQYRVGKDGHVFKIYKIRTMVDGAEQKTGPTWTKPNDPRVTRLGRFLRKLHIDELPQLINVLRGEMALVGPRPERPEFVQNFLDKIPGYADRSAVLPGVTGLAQINLPPDNNINDVRRKLVLDIEYINTAGPLLDLRILMCTALRLVGCPGAAAARLFGVEREVPELPAGKPSTRISVGGNGAVTDQEIKVPGSAPDGSNGRAPGDGNGSQPSADRFEPKPPILANPKPR